MVSDLFYQNLEKTGTHGMIFIYPFQVIFANVSSLSFQQGPEGDDEDSCGINMIGKIPEGEA
ncbi:hypothetical protein CEH05_06200 [Halobacillus halophilus]|uniref:Uncharacterized protein n=1 Tax=Halobacillus halophilus (strain ATCC 35676 / DSM 2266 / JCM 20832 / KCTC 3685 / LMG 17431 / NBRC 102448 / NCIMB 2269) TaxID=866895 RepID=I0JKA8_HALH3|nr:hypothetical protein [Halobacillus halophilus]ASF38723.1 hypothetical protein CEH05_06200 [Halobacillus halophilus]CCG44577.1 hypothetical protein HBHAL_2224 [Halobacillus halophilus DSM 2266]